MSGVGDAIFITVVLGLNAAWLIPVVRMLRRNAAKRAHRQRLLATGRSAPAVVLTVQEVGPYYNRIPHLSFTLRVEPEGEPSFPATALGFFRMIDYPRLQPGGRVEVRFDPADRSIVAVVGETMV
jgi:hypothetical protein